jgi:hypothetical protein
MFNRKIIAMQTDWGGEYEHLNSFFHSIGISHRVSSPCTHQQTGVAERKHRHIVEMGLALLATASMSLKYWDQAFLAATHLINRTPLNFLPMIHPFIASLVLRLIIQIFGFLGALAGLISDPITLINFNFILFDVFFLAIVIFTKGINA